jgi:6-pyruvoyltetrahydropterin/6-carboxytetrahydropterin synthase
MKRALKEVLSKYDHRSFNDFLEYPSVENICLLLRKEIEPKFKYRFTLRVWEGEGKWAEV